MSSSKKKSSKKKSSRKKSKKKSPQRDLFSFVPKQTKKTEKKKETSKSIKKQKKTNVKKTSTDTKKKVSKPVSIKSAVVKPKSDVKKAINQPKLDKNKSSDTKIKGNKLLKKDLKFYSKNETLFGEEALENKTQLDNKREAQKTRYLRYMIENDMICNDMEKGLLLTVEYDGYQNKAYIRFYDLEDKKIKIWLDTTGHQAYCLHKTSKSELETNEDLINFPGFDRIEEVEKYDLLADKKIVMSKVYANTPNVIGGSGSNNLKGVLEGAWEANIRYIYSYIYDEQLVPGLLYSIKNGKIHQIEQELNPEIEKELTDLYKNEKPAFTEIAKKNLKIFSYPIPNIRRVAFDIEVDVPKGGGLPNTKLAKQAVISISFSSNDGMNKVYVLWDENKEIGNDSYEFPENTEILFFDNERDLLKETFRIFWDYPLIITFNGDNFDFNYLFHRSNKLKISKELNPIQIARGGGMVSNYAFLKSGVHLDLYQVFANRSLKGYAFGGAYDRNSLDHITKAFLDHRKIKHDSGDKFSAKDIATMDLMTLAYYNMFDSIITLELTTFNGNMVWNLLVYLMRITKLPLQNIFRYQISAWIRNLMFFEHRANNYLIPRVSEIRNAKPGGIGKSVIDGKGFEGGYVIDPVPGIHFGVVVADFSSLYPSIIKSRNLSYETINCNHDACESNLLPDTPYYVCTERVGIFALVVGFLRDIRVKWFKPRASNKNIPVEERNFAKVLQAALKVLINGSYGVFGSPNFPLYCLPVAEATTTIGRYSIKETIDKAESLGVRVLYGDTDSVFLDRPTKEQIEEIIEWSTSHLKIDLEEEKTYQFLALSKRKKNYVGIFEDSLYVDIKGMTAKKRNTAPFIGKAFIGVTKTLKLITSMDEFEKYKIDIMKKIKSCKKRIGRPVDKGGYTLEDYSVTMALKKNLNQYTNNIPQHVRAAKMHIEQSKGKVKYVRGDLVQFVKTKDSAGTKPMSLASIHDVDVKKYKSLLRGTFEQLLDALGISYEEIEGTKKIDSFF